MPTFVSMVSMALGMSTSGSVGIRLGHYNSLKDKSIVFGNPALQTERRTFNATHFRELVRPYLSLDYELWLYAKEVVVKKQKEWLSKIVDPCYKEREKDRERERDRDSRDRDRERVGEKGSIKSRVSMGGNGGGGGGKRLAGRKSLRV
jgi:hypothetical protein